jgi:TM2 domain-containing membrane protein YozV
VRLDPIAAFRNAVGVSDYGEILMFREAQRLPESRRGEFALAYHVRQKDRSMSLLLSLFLGWWGVDRFYLGQVGLGVAKVFGVWLTFGLWWFVDLFLIMRATDRYNAGVVEKLRAMYAPALPAGPNDAYVGAR